MHFWRNEINAEHLSWRSGHEVGEPPPIECAPIIPRPLSARIWEAARATSAAPTFFQPITINGVKYGDGGTGWNNPTAEALAEAYHIWPSRLIGCLLSLGTGLEEAIQLSEGNDGLSEGFSRSLLQRLAPHPSFQLEVAKYCVTSLTSCEKIHRDVSDK